MFFKRVSIRFQIYIKRFQTNTLNPLKPMIHGTKKQKITKTEQQLKQEQQLSDKINAKLSDFFQIRNKDFSDQDLPKYMEFTALLMQLCSDIPTIFNFRRQLLERAIKINLNDLKKQGELLVNQIKLVTKLIRDDPKSYTLWSFRQWLVQNIYKFNKAIVTEEKQLCKLLLTKDQKNFHVWNYRNWINSVEFNIDEELKFTEEKIKSNPFNFSPYHFRSKYLPLKYSPLLQNSQTSQQIKVEIQKYGMPKSLFDSELQSIKTAIFLNPNEEAPWIYYRWLLKRILPAILLSQKTQNNKHTLVFNERIHNPSQLLKFEKEYTIITKDTLSSAWEFYSEGQVGFGEQQRNAVIQAEGIQKHIVFKIDDNLKEISEIYKNQEQYIRQILEQETNCRFAWLQLLQILKNQLLLTCNKKQWTQITTSGVSVFETLKNQTKTTHYIQKLHQFWNRMKFQQTLSQEEELLIR